MEAVTICLELSHCAGSAFKVTPRHFFSLLLFFFVYFHTIVPEIRIFYWYQLHQLPSRKTATLSQAGGGYLFGRYCVPRRVSASPQPPHTKRKKPKAPSFCGTGSSLTLQVKEFLAPTAGNPLSMFVLPKSTDSTIFWISKSLRNRIGGSQELARCFETFPDRRKEVTKPGLLWEWRKKKKKKWNPLSSFLGKQTI